MKTQSFQLKQEFIEKYVKKTPEWGGIGYVTYKRTYARPLDSISERHQDLAKQFGLLGTEEWWLTVTRVVEGTYEIQRKHCLTNNLRWDAEKAQTSAQEMYSLIFNFKFTPPGRGLWMMGAPVVEKIGGAALNNCAFVSTKDIGDYQTFSDPFAFLMDMSMLGVGVGFDTLGAGKTFINGEHTAGRIVEGVHTVEDTREGWVSVLCTVLDAFQGICNLPEFDYSQIRPAGSPIKGFGGVAAGSEPLRLLVERLTNFLSIRAGKYLTAVDIVDIMNMIGVCVVSGNVRRSAELSIGDPNDEDFLNIKDYNLHPKECANWRWAANNSVAATVGMDYGEAAKRTSLNGDPGYLWLENARSCGRMGRDEGYTDILVAGVNPCSEQTLEDKELCCLAEIYPSLIENYAEFEKVIKYCFLYVKTVTLVSTHNQDTNAVMLRNRRIGVSLTGVVQAMERHGARKFFEWCDEGYGALRARDRQYSRWLCIPPSIKVSSIKPSGTVSLLPGVTPGIHFPHSEYYYRVIRFATNSPLVEAHRKAGYKCFDLAPEESNTTAIYFPVKEKYFSRGKNDVTLWEQVELAAAMQHYWSDNAVSITATFRPEEAKDIPRVLRMFETRLKAISFLPGGNDHGYAHAPYQEISKEEYCEAVFKLGEVDFSTVSHEKTDSFCDGDKCELPPISKPI